MIRILHVAEYAKGGVATYLQMLFQDPNPALEQHLLVADTYAEQKWHLPTECIHTYPYVRSLQNIPHAILAVRRTIHAFRPDICYFHSSWAGGFGRLALFGLTPRPCIFYNAHGWAFLRDAPAWKQYLFAWIERFLAQRTDAIINVSTDENRAAVLNGLSEKKLFHIRSGLPKDESTPSFDLSAQPRELRNGDKIFSFPRDAIKLLFIGRWDPQKGLDVLLQAFLKTTRKDIRLYVLGAGLVDQANPASLHLAELVEQARQDSRITFVGWIAHEELSAWYTACDAVIMPSRWEAFGLVAVEAMKNGRPVLASNRGALPEVVREGQSGHCFSLIPGDIVQLLDCLDAQELQQMRRNAYEMYLSEDTAEHVWNDMSKLYQDVLHQKNACNEKM